MRPSVRPYIEGTSTGIHWLHHGMPKKDNHPNENTPEVGHPIFLHFPACLHLRQHFPSSRSRRRRDSYTRTLPQNAQLRFVHGTRG